MSKKGKVVDQQNNSRAEMETFLTPLEVQRLLKLSRSKLYLEIAIGGLPHLRLGRSIRIPQGRLTEWLRDKER